MQAKTPPPPPYSIPRSATSANINSSVRPPLPNTDPLPTDPGAREGLLNHHASQLKKLADRVESVNEWIEMDGIVLERLLSDVRFQVHKEHTEKAEAVRNFPNQLALGNALGANIPRSSLMQDQ